jgi:hypothetical protein
MKTAKSILQLALCGLGLAAMSVAQNTPAPEPQSTPPAAQQQQPQQLPVQPVTDNQQPGGDSNAPAAGTDNGMSTTLTPGDNTRTASGGVFRFAVPGGRDAHNFLSWSASLQESAQSGVAGVGSNGWSDQTGTGVSFAMNRAGHTQDFSVAYSGGTQFNAELAGGLQPGQPRITYFHNLNITDSLRHGRWDFNLANSTQYTPISNFGFSGNGIAGDFGSLPGIGSTLPTLEPGLLPDQGINNGYSPRVSNTTAFSAMYRLSGKSFVSALASFGLMDFVDGDRLNSRQLIAEATWERRLGARNWIALQGSHARFWFPDVDGAVITSDAGTVGFARQLTSRMSISAFGGPQVAHSDLLNIDRLGYSIVADLAYGWRRNSFALGYSHGVTGGSGALLGATSDILFATFNKPVRRTWSFGVNGGYSRQVALVGTGGPVGSEYGGISIGRSITRETSLSLGCSVGHSDACTVATACDALQHRVNLQLNWNPRPVRVH